MAVKIKKSTLESTFDRNGKLVMVFEGPMTELYSLMSDFYAMEDKLAAGPAIDHSILATFANIEPVRGALNYLHTELKPKTPEELIELFEQAVMQCTGNNLAIRCLEYDLPDDQVTHEQLEFIAQSIFATKDK